MITLTAELQSLLNDVQMDHPVVQFVLNPHNLDEEAGIELLGAQGGELIYVPAKKAMKHRRGELPVEEWDRARPGKFLRKIAADAIKPMLTDDVLEDFATIIKATDVESWATMEVVEGEEIRRLYLEESHARRCGTLAASCMRYDHCQPYLDVYVNNPQTVKMLVMRDPEGKVVGRALVWQTAVGTFLDRIYGIADAVPIFRKYAKSNDWWQRATTTFGDEALWLDPSGVRRIVNTRVELDLDGIELWPHVDTFKYLPQPSNGTLCNYAMNMNVRVLSSNEGGTRRY